MNSKYFADRCLEIAAARLSVTLEGTRQYGWNHKSAGSKAIKVGGQEFWLKAQFAKLIELNSRLWNGEISAPRLAGIRRPQIVDSFDWQDAEFCCRALLFEMAPDKTCSSTPELNESIPLSPEWYNNLRHSIETLSYVKTERIALRQDLIDRRIRDRFGDNIDTTITDWVSIHGDLHWANLTSPQLEILDWESWGLGPRGADCAFLLAYSSLVPNIARDVANAFSIDLRSREGIISTLFAVSELLGMIERHGDHPKLRSPLEALGRNSLTALK